MAVAKALDVAAAGTETLARASLPSWDAMKDVGGLVDCWGGEFCHLFPKVLAVIRRGSHQLSVLERTHLPR